MVATTSLLGGTVASSSATAQLDIPNGPSILQAQASYTISAAMGEALSRYASNERVEKVELIATLGGGSVARLITVSGKSFEVPTHVLAFAGLDG